jgi:uncharacterized protein (DUF924 family)
VAGKLKALETWWAKGGKEEWMTKNPQLTQKITEKMRRKIR